MFRTLPAASWPAAALLELGKSMVGEDSTDDKRLGVPDEEENDSIPAGYTYLGQFIDHDLTFDPLSSLSRINDPDALTNFRTPRFDLDSMYGRGPADQPYLYENSEGNGPLFREHRSGDLPRSAAGTALIGDPRNDENRIISQLHLLFQRFHNEVVKRLQAKGVRPEAVFEVAQREVRWHYQWIVIHDFLERIAGQDTVQDVLPAQDYKSAGQAYSVARPRLHFFDWKNDIFMPVEFAAATYRFGHSMVRPSYHLNSKQQAVTERAREGGTRSTWRVPLFHDGELRFPDDGDSLSGFSPMPGPVPFPFKIEWSFFFDFGRRNRPQPSYKVDTSLVGPLGNLFGGRVVPRDPTPGAGILAVRNLRRGAAMGLPSGEDVARAMGIPLLGRKDIALANRMVKRSLKASGSPGERPFDPRHLPPFEGSTPLWFYILKEAELLGKGGGKQLGPVGARIVAEVFVGILSADSHSYLNVDPGWAPQRGIFADLLGPEFRMPDLIRIAAPDSIG